jgi:hypothetical protein
MNLRFSRAVAALVLASLGCVYPAPSKEGARPLDTSCADAIATSWCRTTCTKRAACDPEVDLDTCENDCATESAGQLRRVRADVARMPGCVSAALGAPARRENGG